METTDLTRDECVRRIKLACSNIRACVKNRSFNPETWMQTELEFRNELVALRTRVLAIEASERDALSIELQKKRLG